MKAKIAICASGEGTNFEALVRYSRTAASEFEVVGLLVSRSALGAQGRARVQQIPTVILNPKRFQSAEAWDQAFLRQLQTWGADWVVLAGFLKKIGPQVLQHYSGRVVNSHPSLLPAFGGAGMYGDRVHEAVLTAGHPETGVTIHLVEENYDRGPLVAQLPVPVLAGDTVSTLSARLKRLENSFYPKIVNDLVAGRLVTRRPID